MKKKTSIIIGIDPGTRVTGYGIIEVIGTKCKALDFGTVRPPPSLETPDRYLVIFEAIVQLIKLFPPQAVAVETQYVQRNVQSALKLGMARAAVLIAARQAGVAVFEISPSRAKKAVVGNGAASKQQVQKMVQHLLHLQQIPTPEDAADALALALCHFQSHTWRKENVCLH